MKPSSLVWNILLLPPLVETAEKKEEAAPVPTVDRGPFSVHVPDYEENEE